MLKPLHICATEIAKLNLSQQRISIFYKSKLVGQKETSSS